MSISFLALNYWMLYSVCDFNIMFYTFPSSQFEFISTFWLHVLYYVLLNFYYFVILSNRQYSLDLDLILILRLARFIILRKIFFRCLGVYYFSYWSCIAYDWCCNWDSINYLLFIFIICKVWSPSPTWSH